MKHKKLFTFATVIFSIIVVVGVFLTVWFWGDSYSDFNDFKQEVALPDLKNGGTPQGLTCYKGEYTVIDDLGHETKRKQDYYLMSYYFDGAPTRIYVVGKTTGYGGYVTLKNEDGTSYTGHAGGIASNGLTLWVCSDSTVYAAKRSSQAYANVGEEIIKKAALNLEGATKEDGSAITSDDTKITFTSHFNANCTADFLYYYDDTTTANDDKLYVGGFYRSASKDKDDRYLLTTPAGDNNSSIVFQYDVLTSTSSTNVTGLTCISSSSLSSENKNVPKIDRAFSIPEKIQGFARTDKKLILSQSYSLADSHLLYYDWTKVYSSSNRKYFNAEDVFDKDFRYEGVATPSGAPYKDTNLYINFIDSSCLLRDYRVPSMSEGLCVVGATSEEEGRVCVLFESGSKKYRPFVRQSLTDVYSFSPRTK